ncbi:SUMO-activating enzyme subunit 2-B-like isoform X2 [Acanthaster planci]|uniref:SUMO-activating enzyme subunit n=1 Tax=Acanthaster planci TaxID=133434 RepID=A0A8B7YZI1_ACAPL|nr:SUMO-activating enzyme subunit 2-B-like isoform X2 [Acanthaster planci]
MAACVRGVLPEDVAEMVSACRVLVVGAGGIGCELLKNLVLTGFQDIVLIDLDTIDVSNLNRQFLFHKKHVGKSKAEVAKESALRFNPNAKIDARHESITTTEYNREFFMQFNVVMNALDNRAARNHVNRMCLAADVPLIESGSGGYLGQVSVIKKGLTECYECLPQPAQKSFPGCTIRNTPSEPIHCIVWAKHLFNQLFGEEDPDQDVSPDTADPEAAGDAGQESLNSDPAKDALGGVERTSTRAWAESSDYNAQKLFRKLFHDDINYLLSMDKLWQKRRPPVPLDWDNLPQEQEENESQSSTVLHDQRKLSIRDCVSMFKDSLDSLKQLYKERGELVWDKDDEAAMDFVTCTSNIRAYIFGIERNTRFTIKSMAGNIIPAIATTNAVVAGLIVMEALKVLQGRLDQCRMIFLKRTPNERNKLFLTCPLDKPNPKCYVCAPKPEASVKVNLNTMTVKALEEKIFKQEFGMIAPDVEINDGRCSILISSEEGETEENNFKVLSTFMRSGVQLKADDFLQNYQLTLNITHCDTLKDDKEFEVVDRSAASEPQPLPDGENQLSGTGDDAQPGTSANGIQTSITSSTTNSQAGPAPDGDDEDDELVMVDEEEELEQASAVEMAQPAGKKRKLSADEGNSTITAPPMPAKKAKMAQPANVEDEDDDLVVLDD